MLSVLLCSFQDFFPPQVPALMKGRYQEKENLVRVGRMFLLTVLRTVRVQY